MKILFFFKFTVSDDVSLPDSLGHSVGPERYELLARDAGDDVSKLNLPQEMAGNFCIVNKFNLQIICSPLKFTENNDRYCCSPCIIIRLIGFRTNTP